MTGLRLVDESGQTLGWTVIDGELVLGRELIAALGGGTDASVSRRHGRLVVRGDDVFVEDLGSRNGTFVNGARLDRTSRLEPGDSIEVGGHRFVFGPTEDSAEAVYAAATRAATRATAPERLRLVYALTQLVDEPRGPRAIARKLEETLAVALPSAEVLVRPRDALTEALWEFGPRVLTVKVVDGGEMVRQGNAVVLPLGAGPAPDGVVAVRGPGRPPSAEDIQFCATAAALAARAIARAEQSARSTVGDPDAIVGDSSVMQAALRRLDTVAEHADLSVLLIGETGTGKELFARRLHTRSGRSGPFVPVNVAALPSELLESELFGHVKGAFTGATEARIGFVERAHGGTLFLDELGEMPLGVQAKLLRVLQERVIHRVGDPRPVAVDLRLVAATNADLEAKMKLGTFREDLYYRVADQQTRIPPLRERGEDIERLARAFLERSRGRTTPEVIDIEEDALARLRAYEWPGNVRQLEGTIRLAVIHAAAEGSAHIGPEHLDERVQGAERPIEANAPWARQLADAERNILARALAACGGNKRETARQTGLSINTLRKRLDKYGIAG